MAKASSSRTQRYPQKTRLQNMFLVSFIPILLIYFMFLFPHVSFVSCYTFAHLLRREICLLLCSWNCLDSQRVVLHTQALSVHDSWIPLLDSQFLALPLLCVLEPESWREACVLILVWQSGLSFWKMRKSEGHSLVPLLGRWRR